MSNLGDEDEDRELLKAIGSLQQPAPPAGIVERFLERAAPRTVQVRWWRSPVRLASAAGVLLVISAPLWYWTARGPSQDLAPTHAAETPAGSSAARLTQLLQPAGAATLDDDALLRTLFSDEDAAIRLAAAEAIAARPGRATLAPAIRRAMGTEDSPFVQVALMDAAVSLTREVQREILEDFLTRTDVDPAVRSDARERLQLIGTLP